MEGNVQVRMTSHSTFGGVEDILRFTGRGVIERTDYGWHLTYTVENTAGGDRQHSDVKVETQSGRALVQNGGEGGYALLLDPRAPTEAHISEGGHTLTLSVATRCVKADLNRKKTGSLLLEYMLMVGMQPVSALRVLAEFRKEDD